jgi:biopolymer transport protein ExbD
MAELLLKSNGSGRAHIVPRIDLTPMVDLGFLLLTFFIMTTTMKKTNAMDIQMPYNGPEASGTAFLESSAITLIPAGNHIIYYYEGIFNPDISFKKAMDIETLRTVIQNKKRDLMKRVRPNERDLQVLIKSHPASTVNDIVALFDEMNISGVKYYAMVAINPDEASKIDKGNAAP